LSRTAFTRRSLYPPCGGPFGPSIIVPGSAYLVSLPFGLWSASLALPTARPILPSTDFRGRVRVNCFSLSHVLVTCSGSPEVRPTAFLAPPPDLPPVPLMDMGFVVLCQLARHRRPPIRFLSIGSRVCSALPSDPTSRRRPCASLAVCLHPAWQSSRAKVLNGLGMMPLFPLLPLKWRTVGFPEYGFKAR